MGFDGFYAAALNGVGVVGLLVGLFYMIATGRLVTRREVNDMRDDRNRWRTVAELATEQNRKLIEKADLTLTMLESIERRAEEADRR